LALRLVAAHRFAYVRGYTSGDQSDYQALAVNLIGGHGYTVHGPPTAWRSPGYPLFLAAAIKGAHAFSTSVPIRGIVGIAQAFVGTATVVVTGALGRRIHSTLVGLVAAATLAVWPTLVVMTSVLLNETLFTFLLVSAMAVLFWSDAPARRQVAWGGALLGLAILTRPVAVPVAVLVFVGLLVQDRTRHRRSWRATPFVVALLVVLLPWTFRNLLDFGAVVPFDTHGGYALCQSNRPGAGPSDPDSPYCAPRGTEVENDRRLTRRALGWMVTHPGSEAALVVRRAQVIMSHDADVVYELADREGPDPRFTAPTAYRLTRLADRFWWAILAPALLGVALLLRDRRTRRMAITYLGVMIVPLLATVEPRLHQPLAPLLALGVGMTVSAVGVAAASAASSRRGRRHVPRPPARRGARQRAPRT
jgi:hypothetical protein